MFACKKDNSNLISTNSDTLSCPICTKSYSINRGIPVFAESLDFEEKHQVDIFKAITNKVTKVDVLTTPIMLNHLRRKKYMDLIKIKKGMKVLDIATQDGLHLRYLKDKFPELVSNDLYAIDITMNGLLLGKELNRDFNYAQASVYELPFKDESFDVIIINGIIEHLDKASTAIIEMSRVLKRGGQFVSFFSIKDYGMCFHWLVNDIFKNKKMIYESTEAIGHDYNNIIEKLHNYKKYFKASGLKTIRQERINILFDSVFDWILLKMYLNRMNIKNKENVNIHYNESKKQNKVSKRQIVNKLLRILNIVFYPERLLLNRSCGNGYLNYGRKE
jgi:ubiquinone/menaquinone biosynthesis C-methylase UbiE